MSRFTLHEIFNKKPRVHLCLSTLHTRFDPVRDIDGHELKQKTWDSIGFESR